MQVNGVIYSLVTDINYLRTRAVWQMLEVCYSVFFIISLCGWDELVTILSYGLLGQRWWSIFGQQV